MTTTLEPVDIPTQSTQPAERRIADDGEALNVAAGLAERLARGAAERDAHRRLPFPELAALSRSGLPAITLPRDIGGADVTARTLVEVHRLVAAADPSIAQVMRSHFACLEILRSQDASAVLFGEAARGLRFALAEKDGGDRTVIASTSDGVVRVDGVKRRATGAVYAHWIGVSGSDSTAFVEADAQGVLVLDDWSGVGLRTAASGTVQLCGARTAQVAAAQPRPGLRSALLGAAIGVGIAGGAVDDAARLLGAEADPLLVGGFGEIYLRARGAEAVLAEAALAVDADAPEAELAVATARAVGTRVAGEVTGALYELVGVRAGPDPSTLHRYWRDARSHAVLDPAHDAVDIVGRRALRRAA